MMYKEITAVSSDIHTKHCRNSIITPIRIDKVDGLLLHENYRPSSVDFLNLQSTAQIHREINNDKHFNFLTTRSIKIMIFCNVKQCNPVGRYQNFGGIFCFSLRGRF